MVSSSHQSASDQLLARQLLNRFRQAAVIDIAVFNRDLLAANADVINIISTLPGAHQLMLHLDNLKSGHTPKDQIDPSAMPFAMVTGSAAKPVFLPEPDTEENDSKETDISSHVPLPNKIATAFETFDSSYEKLEHFQKDFGDDWIDQFSEAVRTFDTTPAQKDQFDAILSYKKLIDLWFTAQGMIESPNTDVIKDLLDNHQDDLNKFGDDGAKLIETLKTLAQS